MESWAELAEQAKADGFTRAIPSFEMPTGGYMVALEGHEETFPAELFCADNLVGYVSRHWDALTSGGEMFLGGWRHGNVIFLDVSECVTSQAKALFLAGERNQLAIWDVAKAGEIGVARPVAGHYGVDL